MNKDMNKFKTPKVPDRFCAQCVKIKIEKFQY